MTTLHATGDRLVPVSFGWHPYFRLPGAPRPSWRLCLPPRRRAELDGRHLPTGAWVPELTEAAALGDRAFDHLYALGDGRRLAIEGGGRRVSVLCGEGYRFAQVFAPPGGDFVCLEPMTAPTNALISGNYEVVEPGGSFSAAFSIRIDRSTPC